MNSCASIAGKEFGVIDVDGRFVTFAEWSKT